MKFVNVLIFFQKHLMHNEYALDCGAGIGRVTKHLLIPMFRKVRVGMDPISRERKRERLSHSNVQEGRGVRVGGLTDFDVFIVAQRDSTLFSVTAV